VVGIDAEHRLLTTKGDNNIVADTSPVSYENVLGRVNFCVPGFGYIFLFLSTRFGKIMLGIMAFGLIGFYIIKRMYYRSLENDEDDDKDEENEAKEKESDKGGEENGGAESSGKEALSTEEKVLPDAAGSGEAVKES
jgi:hypothetical protein